MSDWRGTGTPVRRPVPPPQIIEGGPPGPWDPHESARWAVEASQAGQEFLDARAKVLADAGARGFPVPPGESLADLLSMGMKVKGKLAEQNAKLYDEERQRIYQLIEFNLKIEVAAQKLLMQWYVAELLDLIIEEQANLEAQKEHNRADIETFQATVEQRQANIIRAKAEAEMEVNAARLALAAAQKNGLQVQILLVNAELETAIARQGVIDSVYAVIAAENVVLTAEQGRATALEGLVAAKGSLVAAKQGLVAAEKVKADATNALAQATTADAQRQIQISNAEVEQAGSKISIANLETQIADAKKVIANDETEIAKRKVEMATAEGEIAKARKDLAVAEKNLATAEVEQAAAIGRVAEAEAAVEIARINAQKDVADERKATVDKYTPELTQDIAAAATARAAAIAAEDGAFVHTVEDHNVVHETIIKE